MTRTVLDAEVDALVRGAEDARGRLTTLAGRRTVLAALADAADAEVDRIVATAAEETHLAEGRLRGELLRTTNQLRAFAAALADGAPVAATIDLPRPDATPVPTPDLRSVLEPLGVVAVFSASNFPLAFSVLGGDTASALAAGCPVVVKAHPGHPRLSDLVASIAERAVGPGLVGVVHGQQAGLDLLVHPLIRGASFTGSLGGARALQDRIRDRPDPIPFYGELGSLNPVVILPNAAARRGVELVRELVASFTQSAGQLCTKPGLVLVPSSAGLAERLAGEMAAIDGRRMLTEPIHERFLDGARQLCDAGVTLVAGDIETSDGEVRPVAFTAPASALPDAALEEVFGPATVLAGYDDLGEVFAVLRRLKGSLTGTLHTGPEEDPGAVREVLDALTGIAGRIVHNGWPTGVAVMPAMSHGGPWPAATTSLHTSVGLTAARRFARPVCYQDLPDTLLPAALQDANPLGILRTVDGALTRAPVTRPDGAADG